MNRQGTQQLSLWDESPSIESQASLPQEIPFSWADGDTDIAQLERLATLIKANIQAAYGKCVRILSTRIANGQVWATWEEIFPLGRRVDNPVEDEEDDC